MKHHFVTGILILLAATSMLRAEESLSPGEFEKYVNGKTLTFSQHGMPYGIEQYFSDRSTIWSFSEGSCVRGQWYPQGGLICFIYEGGNTPQCWSFQSGDPGFTARIDGGNPANDLVVTSRTNNPIQCKGPDVGV